MDPKTLKNVIAQVHRRFPEVAGCQPKVHLQQGPQPKSAAGLSVYLLTFHNLKKTQTGNGERTILRWVRVVVNENGKILKISTSR